MTFWHCEHSSPVLVEEVEEGGRKMIARCLRCKETGPIRGEAEEALLALRNQGSGLRRRVPSS